MGLFQNLTTIVAAPFQVLDETIVKPVADLASGVVDEFKGE